MVFAGIFVQGEGGRVRREGDNTQGLSGRVKDMTTWRASVHVYTHTHAWTHVCTC